MSKYRIHSGPVFWNTDRKSLLLLWKLCSWF